MNTNNILSFSREREELRNVMARGLAKCFAKGFAKGFADGCAQVVRYVLGMFLLCVGDVLVMFG